MRYHYDAITEHLSPTRITQFHIIPRLVSAMLGANAEHFTDQAEYTRKIEDLLKAGHRITYREADRHSLTARNDLYSSRARYFLTSARLA